MYLSRAELRLLGLAALALRSLSPLKNSAEGDRGCICGVEELRMLLRVCVEAGGPEVDAEGPGLKRSEISRTAV